MIFPEFLILIPTYLAIPRGLCVLIKYAAVEVEPLLLLVIRFLNIISG